VLARDEGIRSDTTLEKLAALKPSFRQMAPSPLGMPRRSTMGHRRS